ncbi:hypothetical protein RHGRI_029823 [Rhododendron griersonianum]|uniref:Uncharacterized protein n=1 Tax=Rhododendron griersonianum TaxID=479676 RepID=A0AAV6IKU7_9ERIC|nr:hypothetical protein RHGRI_029823 [Rhododendron griersonianum]
MVFNHSAGNTVCSETMCSVASNFISKPNAEREGSDGRHVRLVEKQEWLSNHISKHNYRNDRAAISHYTYYENLQRKNGPHSMDSENSPGLMDANRMALLKLAMNHQG